MSSLSTITTSNIEDFHKRLKRLYPCVDDVSQLPHGWSSETKAPPLGLTHDNLGCYYRGLGRRDEDEKFAAAVRTENHIPPACLLYYFEIRFISKGREGFMGLGLTSATAVLNKLPGWARESYGYHADDGNIFNGDGRGSSFGPTFTSGDVIGCGYNLVEGKCFFTKNGLNLGKAFEDIPSDTLFYPTIGLKTAGEEVKANFGQEEFVYDIEQDLRSLRKNMTMTISNYPIEDYGDWQNTLHKLVQSWLLQNSYPSTAEAFSKMAKIECKDNMQRIQFRNRIQQYVLSGRISEAIKLTNRLCPNMLQSNPNLLFALKCRQFIELISGAESDFQPLFNYAEANDNNEMTMSSNNNHGSATTTTTTANGIDRIDVNGDQQLPPPPPLQIAQTHQQHQQQLPSQPLATTMNATSITASTDDDLSAITSQQQHLMSGNNSNSNSNNSSNGCNGTLGDNNCEKIADQHSTSFSSYQELMDIDQPQQQPPPTTTTATTNLNHTISNDTNNHNHQSTTTATTMNNNSSIYANNQALASSSSQQTNPTKMMFEVNGSDDAQQTTSSYNNTTTTTTIPIVDPEIDSNEQKFAKLILFGQELWDYLHKLDKLYGKNESNEKMLREALGLIAIIDPKNSTYGRLLDPKEREPISQLLNSSILKAEAGESSYNAPMEDVMSHLRDLVRLNNSQGRWLIDQLY